MALLGLLAHQTGRSAEAAELISAAIAIDPAPAEFHNNLGLARQALGRLTDAVACYREAISRRPSYPEAHCNLGMALALLGEPTQALASLSEAARLAPANAAIRSNLGAMLKSLGRLDEAATELSAAAALAPDDAMIRSNLGAVRVEEGRYAEAIADYRAALSRHTGHVAAHRNLLAALLYDPTCDLETLHDEHLAFALAHRPRRPIARPARTGRGEHLRVAYLSSDFCDQPVGRNVVALFEHRDRTAIEVFGYSDVARPDGMTERFRSAADGWRSTVGLTDEVVAELIRADRIDILVILAGRFGDNRPLVAVHRPAPVIVSFHDGATSGLSEVDFWLTDDVLHPAGSRERFTETLLPVPCFYCYPPISEAPPPARRGGHARVVFGSFSNPAKINDRVVSVWGKLLGSIDGSSLILKYHDVYGNAGLRRRISALFAAVGIECERIVFSEAHDSTIQHLSRYEEVDVALDTFPFTGATTTFEAIWMGVPVVTLAGDRFVGRMSASILAAAGLGDFITSSPDRYVEVAADIARDARRRAELRASLRGRILHGPLCDGHGYARSVEAALRSAWNTIASAP